MASTSVFLNVRDLERSIAFYESLGFELDKLYRAKDGEPVYADLLFEGADFGLGHIPWNTDPEFQAWVGTPLGAGVVVYFAPRSVDAVYERAVKAGAVIEVPITDRTYGRLFTMNDPDGYTITFYAEPKRAPSRKEKKAARKGPATRGAKKPAKKPARKPAKKAARRKGAARRRR